MNDNARSKLQACEMRHLRAAAGITRRDCIRNDTVREWFKVVPVRDKIEQRQLSWFGHMVRMSRSRQVKAIWKAGVNRKRKRGRPKKEKNEMEASGGPGKGPHAVEGVVPPQHLCTVR